MKSIKVRIVAGLVSLAAVAGFGWIAISPTALSSAPTATTQIVAELPALPSDSPWY